MKCVLARVEVGLELVERLVPVGQQGVGLPAHERKGEFVSIRIVQYAAWHSSDRSNKQREKSWRPSVHKIHLLCKTSSPVAAGLSMFCYSCTATCSCVCLTTNGIRLGRCYCYWAIAANIAAQRDLNGGNPVADRTLLAHEETQRKHASEGKTKLPRGGKTRLQQSRCRP